MILREEKRDLFTLIKDDKDWYFVQCISGDYKLGAGIALEFEKRFKLKKILKDMHDGKYPDCIRIDEVFNLVTKEKFWHKPTYETLKNLWN